MTQKKLDETSMKNYWFSKDSDSSNDLWEEITLISAKRLIELHLLERDEVIHSAFQHSHTNLERQSKLTKYWWFWAFKMSPLTFYFLFWNKMQKLIDLLRERKPNFDWNHILDMMYSEWAIFIKDWKPVFAWDISENIERMIINRKIWFIVRLVHKEKIDLFDKNFVKQETERFWKQPDILYQSLKYTHLLMILAVHDEPVKFLVSILK